MPYYNNFQPYRGKRYKYVLIIVKSIITQLVKKKNLIYNYKKYTIISLELIKYTVTLLVDVKSKTKYHQDRISTVVEIEKLIAPKPPFNRRLDVQCMHTNISRYYR